MVKVINPGASGGKALIAGRILMVVCFRTLQQRFQIIAVFEAAKTAAPAVLVSSNQV